jgi:hypothetical protein
MWAERLARATTGARWCVTICLASILCWGCQQTPTTVVGSITLDGKAISIAPNERGTIIFQTVSRQGATATGLLDSQGRFKLGTGASSEVAPGKYQVAVSVVQLLPTTEGAEQGAKRITPAKYAAASESGLQADVTPGENEIDFNLVHDADENANPPSPASASPRSNERELPSDSAKEN